MLTRPSICNLVQLPPDIAAWKQFAYTTHFSSFFEKIAENKKVPVAVYVDDAWRDAKVARYLCNSKRR